MSGTKEEQIHRRKMMILAFTCLVLAFAILSDAIWGSELMKSSITYSIDLAKIANLKGFMFFFSYVVFFSIFAGKSPNYGL